MARKSQPVKKPTAKQTAAQKRQTQNRREIWALVCIFLAIFSIICCFNTTAFLIRPFASLIAGLFGQSGRYILPLALIATVVILFTSRGKPVRLRIVSVFTLILTVSAVYHLIQGEALVWEWKVVPALFKGGISGTTGGLLGGLLAMLLKTGITVVGDIAKLPHMLIAGTTGSGKSVCMNTLIVSLLYKAKPDEVRLIMVDPKMVELGVYNGIPQLLIPVVTDPKKAAGALQWTVTEMMRRYRLMSEEGVRDLDSYNKAITGDLERQKLPQIVVVIDELADLMLVAAKEVEESICRIAQMGRASGIHLVIATQRPSADVITGLMKANIPSRIAFAVSSAMESRIILDTPGAEKLVGKGDMLFAPLGQGKPKRVQGCFISDEEVQAVVNAVKAQSQSDYSAEVMEQIERRAEQSGKPDSGAAAQDTGEGDELLPAAVDVILETGQASVSFLQRRLKLGYARAARIVDEMEERGIIGPYEGAKPRQLLITREQWEQMQNGTYAPPAPPVEDELP